MADVWDGEERRRNMCPLNRECKIMLETVGQDLKRLDEDLAPVRDVKVLSNNKLVATLVAALFLTVGGWIYTNISHLPSQELIKSLEEHESIGDKTIIDYNMFKAVTEERLRNIEAMTKDTRQDVVDTQKTVEETAAMMKSLNARLQSTR